MQLPQIISGTVVKENGRGRELGFPTANIAYDGNLQDGVYFAYTYIEDDKGKTSYPSLAFIGTPDTFNDTKRRLEVYILDFDQDIYDKKIEVELLKFSRGNIKFDSVDALLVQMKQDEVDGRAYFKVSSIA